MNPDDLKGLAAIAEYWRVKEEQVSRINARDHTLYLTLASFGASGYAVIHTPEHLAFSLLIPVLTFILGWSYLSNDRKISDIRDYCRDRLAARVSPHDTESGFPWEHAHRPRSGLLLSKGGQFVVDVLTFVGTSMVALGYFVAHADMGPWSYASVVACVLLQAILLTEFIYHFVHETRTSSTSQPSMPQTRRSEAEQEDSSRRTPADSN